MASPVTRPTSTSDVILKIFNESYNVTVEDVKAATTIAVGDILEDETGMIKWDGTGTVVGIALGASTAAVPAKIKVLRRGPATVNVDNLDGKETGYAADLLSIEIVVI